MLVCERPLTDWCEGTFTEGHELDGKTEKQVPKGMIGRRLTQGETERLLGKLA
jgi:hypothetical protein